MAFLGNITAFGLFVLVGFATGLLWANVLQDLWLWFVIPVFRAPALPLWNAYGLTLIGSVFTHGIKRSSEKDGDEAWWAGGLRAVIASVLDALLVWGMGAFVAGLA